MDEKFHWDEEQIKDFFKNKRLYPSFPTNQKPLEKKESNECTSIPKPLMLWPEQRRSVFMNLIIYDTIFISSISLIINESKDSSLSSIGIKSIGKRKRSNSLDQIDDVEADHKIEDLNSQSPHYERSTETTKHPLKRRAISTSSNVLSNIWYAMYDVPKIFISNIYQTIFPASKDTMANKNEEETNNNVVIHANITSTNIGSNSLQQQDSITAISPIKAKVHLLTATVLLFWYFLIHLSFSNRVLNCCMEWDI
jgi:hypothetical protein